MTFLAPWALAVGVASALGVVLLHLVARQRPAAFVLPTTRFIPDQRTLVSRAALIPRDLVLLALRALLLLSAAAAFARPVLTSTNSAMARVVILDRSAAVADPAAAVDRAKAAAADGAEYLLIASDSVSRVVQPVNWDSLRRSPVVANSGASLSSALVAARRAAVGLARKTDSVQLVVVSPIAQSELDSATKRVRALWPGGVKVEQLPMRDTAGDAWSVSARVPMADPLGPALARVTVGNSPHAVRLVRSVPTSADSAFARDGGTVVRWDTGGMSALKSEGLSAAGSVVVAQLARRDLPASSRVAARWADGSAAAVEASVGRGCIRDVGIGVPEAGDLPLHPPFQRIVRSLLTPCGLRARDAAADSATINRIFGTSRAAASASALVGDIPRPSPLAKWLLIAALAFAAAELLVRARPSAVEP